MSWSLDLDPTPYKKSLLSIRSRWDFPIATFSIESILVDFSWYEGVIKHNYDFELKIKAGLTL